MESQLKWRKERGVTRRIVTGDAAKYITKLVRSLFPGKEYSHQSQARMSLSNVFLRFMLERRGEEYNFGSLTPRSNFN
jgi:hypothetical protein